mgnify:CR=1 FL=1
MDLNQEFGCKVKGGSNLDGYVLINHLALISYNDVSILNQGTDMTDGAHIV